MSIYFALDQLIYIMPNVGFCQFPSGNLSLLIILCLFIVHYSSKRCWL